MVVVVAAISTDAEFGAATAADPDAAGIGPPVATTHAGVAGQLPDQTDVAAADGAAFGAVVAGFAANDRTVVVVVVVLGLGWKNGRAGKESGGGEDKTGTHGFIPLMSGFTLAAPDEWPANFPGVPAGGECPFRLGARPAGRLQLRENSNVSTSAMRSVSAIAISRRSTPSATPAQAGNPETIAASSPSSSGGCTAPRIARAA